MTPSTVQANVKCPTCGAPSKVIDSKQRQNLGGRLRYRKCLCCENLFKTLQIDCGVEQIYQSSRKASVKFTPQDVKNIREAYFNLGISSCKIAQHYGCSVTSVVRILRGKVHANIR